MFVVITIVCVVLGLVVRPAEEQRRAVAALRKFDKVEILYNHELRTFDTGYSERISEEEASPPGPAWLRDLIGIDYFADVVSVALSKPRIRDDDLRGLRHFSKLKTLHLGQCDSISDTGL